MNKPKQDVRGYALLTALIVTTVSSALVLGFISQVNTEQKIARNDTDYSGAFYAAEAGLEKLNSDLSKLFLQSVFPTQSSLTEIQTDDYRPGLPGTSYTNYTLTGGQSTRLTAALNTSATTVTVQSTTGWPSTGFFMVDAEEFSYTGKTATTFTGVSRGQTGSVAASHNNNATVFRSRVVTLSEGANSGLNAQVIPFTLDIVAQSGVGTEARLTREVQAALIPVFQFGIFSDSDLSFFAGPDFSFGGRVHSNGNIFISEGNGSTLTLSQKVTSASQIVRAYLANGYAAGSNYTGAVRVVTTPGSYRNLALNEGSVVGNAASSANSAWPGLSLSTYNGNILSKATGGKPLVLPFVASGNSPIELIRRPPAAEGTDTLLGQSRLANQASIRVYISDTQANLPGGSGYALNNTLAGYTPQDVAGPPAVFRPPFAEAAPSDPDFVTAAGADETASAPLINGYIYIERQNDDQTWSDVTLEILNLGIATNQPNAILRFQRPRWDLVDTTNSLNATDYVPINMYDAREGRFRDDDSTVGNNLRKLGIMNIVELDVNNLKRWFSGAIGTTGTNALNNSGYIFYFSDRRGNRNSSGNETGELGFEDFVNPGDLEGDPNGVLNSGEDLNKDGALQTYGANLPYAPYTASTDLYATAVPTPVNATAIDVTEPLDTTETGIDVSMDDNITVPGYYKIGSEIVNCTSKSSDTLTCTRGQLGTAASAHAAVFIDLNEALDTTETGIDVSSAAGITVPGFYRIDSEILYCTSKAGNTLTCERGRLGSTAAAHDRIVNFVTEDLTNSETGIDVGSATAILTPGYYKIDNEIVKCTSKSGSTLTCTRGVAGTAAVAHPGVSTTVNEAIDLTETGFDVTSATGITVPGYYRIDNEIINCTSKAGVTLTCARAQQGTTAATHTSGTTIRTQMEILAINVWNVEMFTSQRASKNRVHYFRRALRLTNGASPNLPTPGFTVAAENPIYVMGNYNSNGTANFADTHSFAAVIGDAVTLLSNAWTSGGDDRSFVNPYSPGSRAGTTTWYRMAIASGKGINFNKPSEEDDQDFGTDGGAHNFLRYLESWSGATSNYRGSIVSLYYYRQSVGPFKCCNTVYGPPTRAYAFDTDFLVPSQLPPGTPRFRDINNLAFRQTIRAD